MAECFIYMCHYHQAAFRSSSKGYKATEGIKEMKKNTKEVTPR
jgi:hypothetical protein